MCACVNTMRAVCSVCVLQAVKFGAEHVFRSTESSITTEDIDAIIARGKARTTTLLEEHKKGDAYDLSLKFDGSFNVRCFISFAGLLVLLLLFSPGFAFHCKITCSQTHLFLLPPLQAQTFQGVDYSDPKARQAAIDDELRSLMAAEDLRGAEDKRSRKPVANYNEDA